jgi:hypothetical protein
MSSWELADFVRIGCCASNACMSPRHSMIRDRIATDQRLLLIVPRYADSWVIDGARSSRLLQVIPRQAH